MKRTRGVDITSAVNNACSDIGLLNGNEWRAMSDEGYGRGSDPIKKCKSRSAPVA